MRASLQRLLSDAPPKGGLGKAVAVAHRRIRWATVWGWAETARQLSPFLVGAAAPFVHHADVGFDPRESWGMVFARLTTTEAMARYQVSEDGALARSDKLRAAEAGLSPEGITELQVGLLNRGLVRVGDDDVRAYFAGLADMMVRVNDSTCAAIARGTIEPNAMENALTHISPGRIYGFLQGKTAAILAEAEGKPSPPFGKDRIAEAEQRLLAALAPEGRQRYERINQAEGAVSDDDLCWLLRTMYGGAMKLPPPDASAWARAMAAMAIPTPDSTTSHP